MKTLLYLTILFSTTYIYSQKPDIEWGDEFKTGVFQFPKIISSNDTEIYLFRHSTMSVNGLIEKYDANLNLIYAAKPELPMDKQVKTRIKDPFFLNNQLYITKSTFNTATKDNSLYAYSITEDGVINEENGVLLDNHIDAGKASAEYEIVISKDSSQLLLYYPLPGKSNENLDFQFRVFDQSLNIVWEKEIELPYKNRYTSIEGYIIDNLSNVYMLVKVEPDRSKGEKNTRTNQATKFLILGYNYAKGETNEYEVTLPDSKWIVDMHGEYSPHTNQLTIGGLYSNDLKTYQSDGIYYMKLDITTNEIKSVSYKPFSNEIKTEILGRIAANKDKGISNFEIRQFISKENGGSYIVAEQFYIRVVTSTDPKTGVTSTRYYYVYNNIVVASMNNQGIIEWISLIKKESTQSNSGSFLSYAINHNKKNDDLYFIYNDNLKNFTATGEPAEKLRVFVPNKKMGVSFVKMDNTGMVTKSLFLNPKEIGKIAIQPNVSTFSDGNSIIVYALLSKGGYRLGRIHF
ncbi:MAG: hypothetical protein H3C31_09540 [Brumimicrobium sp.]|nr:hypothetical protein [Brumimicrobium sp.]